jgi:hypothetical protein
LWFTIRYYWCERASEVLGPDIMQVDEKEMYVTHMNAHWRITERNFKALITATIIFYSETSLSRLKTVITISLLYISGE